MTITAVICIMGPTASGKTDLAVELVQRLPCEIISVDSAMVYRGMDIGTAKPNAEVLRIAPHRLLDIRDPAQIYSAGDFQADANNEIIAINNSKRIPLLVGGTMLYFHVLQNGIAALPKADPIIRQQIVQEAEMQGWPALHARLQTIDPIAAQRIHPNDAQRIQRFLEIYEVTQTTPTSWFAEQHSPTLATYNPIFIGLIPSDRSKLHQKIAQRFHLMLQAGFIAEVENLFQRHDLSPELPAIRAVGYRQIWEYLAGELTFDEMQEQSIIATRQLAKRQLTWLKNWDDLHCFESDTPMLAHKVIDLLKQKIQW